MRVERFPGMANVLRFPVERRARPTIDLLRELAPDLREVLNLAEAFGMDAPLPDLRERTDAATAEHTLNQAPPGGVRRRVMLDELEAPVVARAIEACWAAHDTAAAAAEARQALQQAVAAGSLWIEPLRDRADALAERAVRLMLEAHALAEEAEGVVRAVGLARRGESWAPRDHEAETDALIAIGRRAAG